MGVGTIISYYYASVSESARAYTHTAAAAAAMLSQVEMRRWPRTYISKFLLMRCDSHRRNGRVGV